MNDKMNSERLRQVEKLYQEASELDPAQRQEFLQNACAGDGGLHKEVVSLLSCEDEAKSFLEVPALLSQISRLPDDREEDSSTLTGRRIGRYQIGERVGRGGMGVVYRALDTRLGRAVALKVLLPGLASDEERRNRFAREAKAASALNHPNIITIFDIDQIDGEDFIAMEYIEGQTLGDLISHGELAVSDALNYAMQIAQALVAAHSAGIIHRDIKPANIMIASSPARQRQVKMLDFGLAKLSESSLPGDVTAENTMKGSILGTAAYMSPEQAEGKTIDFRSDIFSFGSVLYEMFSRRRAFAGDSSLAILSAVLHQNPAPLQGVPANLQNIVDRCLKKDPGLRYQSTADLQIALDGCLPFSIGSARSDKTVAVLPFANLSSNKENEYFSDGLTEELINALTRVHGLRVTARTSAFALRGKGLDIREIGARLNVDHIIEGSVRSSGNRVRVTAQAINVADGYQLWSERYDRELTDVLAIQDEISHAIADTLRVHLVKDAPIAKRHTASPEAYSLYLRGRHWQEKHTPEAFSKARECYERALADDPRYTLASLGLAEIHWQNAFYSLQYPKDALASAKEATMRALQIEDFLPEGHALLGTLLGIADGDWQAADLSFQRAFAIDENLPYVLYRYANFYLWPQGRQEEAIEMIERVLAFDPLSVVTHWVLAYFIYARKEHDRAIKHLLAIIDKEPTFYLAYCIQGLAYAHLGAHRESISALKAACALSPGNPLALGMRAFVLAKAGKIHDAQRVIAELRSAEEKSFIPAKSLMFAYAGLGDSDNALFCAEKSIAERDPMTVMNLRHEPALDLARNDPRFRALLRKMNLQA
jgi:eukaryotic-like serine/threonine-protein kinase